MGYIGRSTIVCLLIGLGALLGACGQPVGASCMITGSGFTAKDPCANQCLSRWSLRCPDGSRLTPNVCTGKQGCTPGSCPQGQVCYSFDDPFEERSYCIPDNLCGGAPTSAQLRHWERDSAARAAAIRAKYEAKSTRQGGKVAPTAEPVDLQSPAVTE